jgi:hypothetical protein
MIDAGKLAKEIAAGVFINGAGQEAWRLMLILPNGRDVGGWSRGPFEAQVRKIIEKALKQHGQEDLPPK